MFIFSLLRKIPLWKVHSAVRTDSENQTKLGKLMGFFFLQFANKRQPGVHNFYVRYLCEKYMEPFGLIRMKRFGVGMKWR